MKLRIRSFETKETIRIEAPDSSSLLDLKTLIAGKLSSSSSSTSISPGSIALSLNRKDELISLSPEDTLHSFGLTSGDLIFYTQTLTLTLAPSLNIPNCETNKLSDSALISGSTVDTGVEMADEAPSVQKFGNEIPNPSSEILKSEANKASNSLAIADMDVEVEKEDTLVEKSSTEALTLTGETSVSDPEEDMEADMETENNLLERSPSVPNFLKRVMQSEKEEIKSNLGFFVVAVHAVFLEAGFVVSNGDNLRLPKGWNLASPVVSVQYTLSDLLGQIQERDVKDAVLKFSVMGNIVSVYGFLSGESPDVYRLCLDLSKVVPLIVFVAESMSGEEEKAVFEFWKTVKDGLCLPLLIDVCQKNGLPLPSCFTCLPTDLKIKVMELLPGDAVARVACTGSEMRYLTSNNELWKQKFVEEFGLTSEREVSAGTSWKEKFKHYWLKRKQEKRGVLLEQRPRYVRRRFMPRYPPFAPNRFPFVGGDYDRFPAIGDFGPIGPGLGLPARRNFSPHCSLDVHDDDLIG